MWLGSGAARLRQRIRAVVRCLWYDVGRVGRAFTVALSSLICPSTIYVDSMDIWNEIVERRRFSWAQSRKTLTYG